MTSLTADAQTDINYTVNHYNTLSTEYHKIVAEYKKLHTCCTLKSQGVQALKY